MHLPASLLTRFSQRLDEAVPINIVQKDVVALITTAHDVTDRTGILESELPGHGHTLNKGRATVKT